MKNQIKWSVVWMSVALAIGLVGCASPKEIRELTRESNKNINHLSKAIQKFKLKSDAAQKKLVKEIDKVNKNAVANELRLQKNRTIWQLAGANHKEKFWLKTQSLAGIVAKAEQIKSVADATRRQKEILDNLGASKDLSAELKTLRDKIAKLLQSDDDFKDRLKTLWEYSKDVGQEVRSAEKKKEGGT